MLQEFKKFVMRGNVIDMAVGIVVGTAFGAIVKSFVADVIMPPIGLLIGGIDFSNLFQVMKQGEPSGPYASLADAQAAGAVTLNYGLFINTIITFIIIALAIFMVVRSINKMSEKKEKPAAAPTTKDCPYCLSTVAIQATRCPQCTSELKAA